MGEWLQPIIAWVDANPHWAGAAVFLVSFAESMAIVGLLVRCSPGPSPGRSRATG